MCVYLPDCHTLHANVVTGGNGRIIPAVQPFTDWKLCELVLMVESRRNTRTQGEREREREEKKKENHLRYKRRGGQQSGAEQQNHSYHPGTEVKAVTVEGAHVPTFLRLLNPSEIRAFRSWSRTFQPWWSSLGPGMYHVYKLLKKGGLRGAIYTQVVFVLLNLRVCVKMIRSLDFKGNF